MLQKTSAKKIYLYQFLTFGFYYFYWCSRSRRDINASAHKTVVPTTWLLVVPLWNYWWAWQYATALEAVSFARIKRPETFGIYIIATAFLWIAFSAFDFIPNGTADHQTLKTIWIELSVIVAAAYVSIVAGLGFFCATMQNKINALPKSNV